jgi:diaminopimelate decarboxylase
LLVVDLDVVDETVDAFMRCAQALDFDVSYAAKAFANVEFIRHLSGRGIGLDVCSLGELLTAQRAGFATARLTLHGAGKTDDELLAACRGRVGYIVVDAVEELQRLGELAREQPCAQVILRLNTGIEARTHASVRTGGNDTKFGIDARDESAARSVLRANPHLPFAGLHAHIGSQIRQSDAYVATAAALLEAAARFAQAGQPVQHIVIGGGFAVSTHPQLDGESLDVAATIAQVEREIRRWANASGLPAPRLAIEPGRAIVALAGTTLYRVLSVKRQSRRTFVVVDGGIAENPRPALYGARHEVLAVSRPCGDDEEVTLCGRSCENDELAIVALPRDVRTGDLLAMCATGAYTYSMAGNYNRFPRPAVVALSHGQRRLLARRETIEDVLRNDVGGAHASARRRWAF